MTSCTVTPPAPPTVAPSEVPPTVAPSEVPPTTAPSAETVEIKLMHQFTEGSKAQPLLVEYTEKYMQANPNIKVTWDWAGWEQYDQKMQAKIVAGDPPDAVWNSSPLMAVYAREGLLQPIDNALKEQNFEDDAVWADTFLPGLLQQAYVQDASTGPGYYAVPTDMHISGILYDKDMLARMNLQAPQTWADVLNLAEKFKAAGISPFAQDGGYTPYNFRVFMYLAIRIGGETAFYDTALHKEGFTWKDNPDWLKAAQEFQNLTTKYFQPGFLGSQWPAAQTEWANGKAAMMIIPTWLPSEMLGTNVDNMNIGIVRFPAYAGGKGDQTATELKFNGFGVLKQSRHPKETLDFLKYLSSRQVQEVSAAEAVTPSPIVGVALPAQLSDVKGMLADNPKMIPMQNGIESDAPEWMANVAEPLIGQLADGTLTPEKFIAELQAQSDAFYTK
jgi:ABC-type glycerol-3-phosphate transport system substrate-binding protein